MPDGSSNAFRFTTAVRENTPMVMALAGASGSGKTFTALELAMGLADGGKIAVIDTEGRRALHYADLRDQHNGGMLFRFDHCELRPPFSPDRFVDAMKAAEGAGYRVIVIDSFSDEHEGEGGLIDMAAAGTNSNTAANWARPKAAHKMVVRWLRQARCHVIFCLRAEERVRLEKDEKGKIGIVPIGWQPVCEKRFMYDMTASFLLSPERPGIPEPIKLQEQHRRFFPKGAVVTRDSGRQLATWAAGGAPAQRSEPGLVERAEQEADKGYATLEAFWHTLSKPEKRQLQPELDSLKKRATDADTEANQADDEDPFGLPPARGAAATEPASPDSPVERSPAGPPSDVARSSPAGERAPSDPRPWPERFAALAPRPLDLAGDELDWPGYATAAVALIGEASEADLAQPITTTGHMARLRTSDGDSFGQVREAINARLAALRGGRAA